MTYARIENGIIKEYPIFEGDIRLRFPNVSFPPRFEPPAGYVAVVDVVPPQIDHTQNLTEGDPVQIDGTWKRQWIVSDATNAEVAERIKFKWDYIRADRNSRLSACDWTQLPDAPVDAAIWAEYRQALRDITDQADPFNITWPKEPE